MATSAVGIFAVLGKLLSDGEVLRASILIERRHIVGRWGRGIIENHLNDPGAAGDGVGAFSAVVHAEHGGAGDDTAIARIFHRHAGEGVSA